MEKTPRRKLKQIKRITAQLESHSLFKERQSWTPVISFKVIKDKVWMDPEPKPEEPVVVSAEQEHLAETFHQRVKEERKVFVDERKYLTELSSKTTIKCKRCGREITLRVVLKGERISLPYCPYCSTVEESAWTKRKENIAKDAIQRQRWEAFLKRESPGKKRQSLFWLDYNLALLGGHSHFEAECFAISEARKRKNHHYYGGVINPETVDDPFGNLYCDHDIDLLLEFNANIKQIYERLETKSNNRELLVFSALLMRRGIDNFLNGELQTKVDTYLPYTEEELEIIKKGTKQEAIYVLGFSKTDKANKTFKRLFVNQAKALYRALSKCPIPLPASFEHVAF